MNGGAGRPGGPPGFTLVELIVALTVLTVAVLGLSASAVRVAGQIGQARLALAVRVMAQAQLETRLAGGSESLVAEDPSEGGFGVEWEVSGERPRRLTLVVSGRRGTAAVADTLVVLERAR